MISPLYSQELDALRVAYAKLNDLEQSAVPPALTTAITATTLPLIKEPPEVTDYTAEQATTITHAFLAAESLPRLQFLRIFEESRLIHDYNHSAGDLSFLVSTPAEPSGALAKKHKANQVHDAILHLHAKAFYKPDTIALATASPELHDFFKKDTDKIKLEKLLLCIVHGKEDQAKQLLRLRPDLLTQRGNVRDYSGRSFYNVSPWECMHWVLDTHYMGQMMFDCIPEEDNALRKELVAQYNAMKGGENDLLRLDDDIHPSIMAIDAMEGLFANLESIFNNPEKPCFMNKDALLYWRSNFYYLNKESRSVTLLEPSNIESEKDLAAFHELRYVFETMPTNTSRKSTDQEHAIIHKTMGHSLDRKGLHYEQPAACKSLVRIAGTINPKDIIFRDIASLFDTKDALLLWNGMFYYANKADSSVSLIAAKLNLSAPQRAAFEALKLSINSMPVNAARLPKRLEEHELINMLFAEHPAFKPTQHQDSHYNYDIINDYQTYLEPTDGITVRDRRELLWLKIVKAQRNLPANALQEICEPARAFFPLPDFKATALTRQSKISHLVGYTDTDRHLLSREGLDPLFGFEFGLIRWQLSPTSSSVPHLSPVLNADARALCQLYKTRVEDGEELQHRLSHEHEHAPAGLRGGAGGPE